MGDTVEKKRTVYKTIKIMTVVEEPDTLSRSETITEWYVEVFPLVAIYVQRKGGNLEEAKEIFQDAIVLYYEKLALSDFNPEKTDAAYLMGIAKNRWFKYCSERTFHEDPSQIDIAEEKEKEPITRKLMHFLRQSGEKCMDILQAFYYEKLTMIQVADRFGYMSERSATVQKYKCLEKVRDNVKLKSLSYEDFLS